MCLMQPTLGHGAQTEVNVINVANGAIDKRGFGPALPPTTGQERPRDVFSIVPPSMSQRPSLLATWRPRAQLEWWLPCRHDPGSDTVGREETGGGDHLVARGTAAYKRPTSTFNPPRRCGFFISESTQLDIASLRPGSNDASYLIHCSLVRYHLAGTTSWADRHVI